MPNQGALAHITPAQIIPRYLADEKVADIASSLGVHVSALQQWLMNHCEDDWRDAQVARSLTAYEASKEAVARADDSLCLARATVQLKSAQWELERTYRRIYGQDVPVNSAGQITINIGMRREKLIVQDSNTPELPNNEAE